jgi:4-hydroxy-tetrahydrodipicolinate synthase
MKELNRMMTALVTPYTSDDTVDFAGLVTNIEYQLGKGVDGFLVNGSTGEALSLSEDERTAIVEKVIKTVGGKACILVGVVTETTAQAIRLAKHAASVGADAIMVGPSCYCKLDKQMIKAHFTKICSSVSLRSVLYNNLYASNIDIPVNVMVDLINSIPNATHVKECSFNSIQRIRDIRMKSSKKVDFVAGWDDIALESFFVGATGWTSIGANTAPALCLDFFKKASRREWDQAWYGYEKLVPYFEYFLQTGPVVPIMKYANDLLGIAGGPNRSPRLDLTHKQQGEVKQFLLSLGLL